MSLEKDCGAVRFSRRMAARMLGHYHGFHRLNWLAPCQNVKLIPTGIGQSPDVG